MTTENLFELATRQKFRFATVKGDITAEQLWDLPLLSKTGFDLDTVARQLSQELKSLGEESFVTVSNNPGKLRHEQALDLVKHVINVRIAEADNARKSQERKAERQRLMEILGQKEDDALRNLTPEEIRERLKALDA